MKTIQQNINTLKEEAVNSGKVIYRSTLTVDNTVKTLATDLAAIVTAGKGSPRYASFSVISTELTGIVARNTQDGTDPVATTTGDPMYNKDKFYVQEYYNLQRFKYTREAAYTTTIEVTYYK